MANVTQISLESLLCKYLALRYLPEMEFFKISFAFLVRATNPNNPTLDTVAVNAFFALINKERDGPSLGVRVIATRLPTGSEKEVLSTLNVLDSCMSKCGTAFQNEVGKFRY